MNKLVYLLILLIVTSASAGEESGIKHIVLCWLNNPDDKNALHEVMQASGELKDIKYVDDIVVGQALSSQRPVVDDTFHVGLVMNFHQQSDLNNYLVHEEHVKRVRETLSPQCNRILIYDIVY